MRYFIFLLLLSTTALSQNYQYALEEAKKGSHQDITAPTNPEHFEAHNISDTTADLTWIDTNNILEVADYRLYNNGELFESTKGLVSTYKLTGLQPSSSYNFTLRAVDAAGNESKDSNNVLFTTKEKNAYTLKSSKRVSIGIYDKDNNLLRTLVTNESKTAGTYTPPPWDGLDDDGKNVTEKGHHYLIIANNIEAEWEGIIGNSSKNLVGTDKWRSQNFPKESIIIGNDIYFAWGGNEQSSTVQKASLNDYQRRIPLFYEPRVHPGFTNLAYDGNMLYMAGQSFWSTNGRARSYVCATTLANAYSHNNWHTFSQGTAVPLFSNNYKAADYIEDTINEPFISGLTVQTGNDNLFVFREKINSIHVIHKTTGALRQDITTYVKPKLGKIDRNGYLWFVHGDTEEILERFSINNSTGAITSTGLTLTGLTNVQAMNITPDGTTIMVGDITTYDQFAAYSTADLSYKWTLGRAESYSEDATVYNDKFMLNNALKNSPERYNSISFESDGSIWIIDEGNERFLKFDASRNYVDQIIWKSNFYSVNIDHADPTRLFTEFMEYEIDYSKPLIAGQIDQAWKLVRNWGKISVLESEGINYKLNQPLLGVETLPNGRTYGYVGGSPNGRKFIEFVKSGVIRNTGIPITYSHRPPEYRKGGILTTYDGSGVGNLIERSITGFNVNHNPIISSPTTITTITRANYNFFTEPGTTPYKTDNNIVILFDKRTGDAGYYHLAGYRLGQDYPVFRTTKSVLYNPTDPYPLGTNTFDVRESVVNAASKAMTMDDWFIWGYFGEFWRNSQTNYWHMLTEEGLFLYDFGTDNTQTARNYAAAGKAGNGFSYQLVKHEGQVYLYHNDENVHGGVHRWKINNLSSIEKIILRL